MSDQIEEAIAEIRALRSVVLDAQSSTTTVQTPRPPAIAVAPEALQRPIVGDAVYVHGPPHNPTFRCPITNIDGSRTYGPEAHSKSLAKFKAQELVASNPTLHGQLSGTHGSWTREDDQAHNHHHGVGQFVRAAARGIRHGASGPDRFAAGVVGQLGAITGLAGLAGVRELGPYWKEIKESFQSRIVPDKRFPNYPGEKYEHPQIDSAPSNKQLNKAAHVENGNVVLPGDDTPIGYPKMTIPIHGKPPAKGAGKKKGQPIPDKDKVSHKFPLPPTHQMMGPHKDVDHGYDQTDPYWDGARPGASQGGGGTAPVNHYWKDFPENKPPRVSQINGRNGEATNTDDVHKKGGKGKGKKKKMGKQVKKYVKKEEKKIFKNTIAKAPKKQTLPIEVRRERFVATRYFHALKNPTSVIPPALGGAGLPTNIVMGYLRASVTAGSISGLNASSVSATTVGFMLNPAMFVKSQWNYTGTKYVALAPVIGFANAAGQENTTYDTATANANTTAYGWSNATQLSNLANNARARVLSSGISITTRCNGTSKSPILFAGTIESYTTGSNVPSSPAGVADIRAMIASQNYNFLVADPSFQWVDSQTVSNCYRPNSSDMLLLTEIVTDTTALSTTNPYVQDAGFPYVGATGLSSECVIYIEAVAWYEILPSISGRLYGLAEHVVRVNPMDVYNELPPSSAITFISPKPLHVNPSHVRTFAGHSTTHMLQQLTLAKSVECAGCGVVINQGKLCPTCWNRLHDPVDSDFDEKDTPAPRLVGIEPNPGPSNWATVQSECEEKPPPQPPPPEDPPPVEIKLDLFRGKLPYPKPNPMKKLFYINDCQCSAFDHQMHKGLWTENWYLQCSLRSFVNTKLVPDLFDTILEYLTHNDPAIGFVEWKKHVAYYIAHASQIADNPKRVNDLMESQFAPDCLYCDSRIDKPHAHGFKCDKRMIEVEGVFAHCMDQYTCGSCGKEHHAGVCDTFHVCPCEMILYLFEQRFPNLQYISEDFQPESSMGLISVLPKSFENFTDSHEAVLYYLEMWLTMPPNENEIKWYQGEEPPQLVELPPTSIQTWTANPEVESQLSGSHGSWTMEDDVKQWTTIHDAWKQEMEKSPGDKSARYHNIPKVVKDKMVQLREPIKCSKCESQLMYDAIMQCIACMRCNFQKQPSVEPSDLPILESMSSPVSQPGLPIVPKPGPKKVCSECEGELFWSSKFQLYVCPKCTFKDESKKTKPTRQPTNKPVEDVEYAQQPAKKRVQQKGNREYFRVNMKGKTKHATYRLKRSYETAKRWAKVIKPVEQQPKVSVKQPLGEDAQHRPIFHDDLPQKVEVGDDTRGWTQPKFHYPDDEIKPPTFHDDTTVGLTGSTTATDSKANKTLEELKEFLEYAKYKDLYDDLNKFVTPEPEIYHSVVKDKWFLSNNENRKFIPKLKKYIINMDEFSRYPRAPGTAKENVSDLIVARHYIGNKEIYLPSTLVDELAAFFAMHRTIDDKVYDICTSVAAKSVRNITGVKASVQTDSIIFGPYFAWKEVYVLKQIIHPFSDLPYRTVGGYENLSIIDHSNYKLDDVYYGERDLSDRVNPGMVLEDYKLRCLPRCGRNVKILWRKLFSRVNYRSKRLRKLTIDTTANESIMNVDVRPRKDREIQAKFTNPAPSNYAKQYYNPFYSNYITQEGFVPAPRLVGIEPNPGPVQWYNHTTMEMPDPEQKPGAGFKYPVFDKYTHKRYDQNQNSQAAYFWNHKYRPVCYSNNVVNERSTVANRVTVKTPEVDKALMSEFIGWFKNNFSSIIDRKWKEIEPVSWNAYLDRSNASPHMKKKLQVTYEEMEATGYTDDSNISEKLAWYWSTRKLFLKKENLPYRTPFGRKAKTARAIQGLQNLQYLVILGPWFMALQDHMKTIWNKNNWACLTSGVDAVDAAAVLNDMWTVIEDDISTFDSSVHELLGELEIWVTKKFGASESIIKLMRANNSTHGVTMLGGKYWMPGGRKSGDPFTTLYNSMLNIGLHAFILHKHFNWTIRTIKKRVRMLVAGDDNLMTINASAVDFVPYMARLGFKSEAIVRDSLDTAEFCSCRLYQIQGKWVFGPMPGKVLSKLGFINSPPDGVSRESMLKGIAAGLTRVCSFIPPIAAVARRILEITQGVTAYHGYATRFKEEFWHMHFDYSNFDSSFNPDIYASLYLTYGWTYCMQQQLEVELQSVTLDVWLPENTVLNILFDHDTAGPAVMAA